MKKFLFIRIAVLSTSLFFMGHANSQAPSADKLVSLDYNRRNPAPATGGIESADRSALVAMQAQSAKMFKDFTTSFKNAKSIKMRTENGETYVSCFVNEVLTKVDYTKKGKWLYTIRYYEFERLPAEISDIVSEGYPRYSICGFVSEVTVPGSKAYLVMIENKNSWKRVRVVDGAVDTYEEYKKP